MVPNVIIIIGLILVTASNVILVSLFINPLCTHAVFERSTDKEWHNSFKTSSNDQRDSFEQVAWVLATQTQGLSVNN